MRMHWIYLAAAGLFEIGWIFSLKFSEGFTRVAPLISYALCGLGAAFFLSQSLKELPVGLAYAVWTGTAIVGSNVIAVLFLGEPASVARILYVLMIVGGVAGLRLST
ncbi:MAG TPA: multidrug efflux SMR transporter [Thermodesulfovibrionales bacterium]|jgi:quaternary ammonium compound-resistance protein SugE|nr:multidrug efflux SMR transporter [Thermodesulfovibrionales bacterium]